MGHFFFLSFSAVDSGESREGREEGEEGRHNIYMLTFAVSLGPCCLCFQVSWRYKPAFLCVLLYWTNGVALDPYPR